MLDQVILSALFPVRDGNVYVHRHANVIVRCISNYISDDGLRQSMIASVTVLEGFSDDELLSEVQILGLKRETTDVPFATSIRLHGHRIPFQWAEGQEGTQRSNGFGTTMCFTDGTMVDLLPEERNADGIAYFADYTTREYRNGVEYILDRPVGLAA